MSAEARARDAGSFQTENDEVPGVSGFTSFENFSILIDELLKDFKLPGDVKRSYYKLCCSQITLLHSHLEGKTNHIMVAGIIMETVRIADELKKCQLSTTPDEFKTWDETLNALELHGMNVGFLRARLHCLQAIANDPEVLNCRQKYSKMCYENAQAAQEIRRLQATLHEMVRAHENLEAEIDTLKSTIQRNEMEFREQARAPW